MSEEAPADGPAAGEEVDDSSDTTTPAPVDTTTAGARMMMIHPWLAAAAVAVYATKVMWVKFREIGVAKQKKLLKNPHSQQPKSLQDIEEEDSELESEAEDDDVPQQLEDDASICQRSIEVASADC
ncbi:uncharacterized protein LOC122613227 [Drosophila teissieri]|uniref:uncharacterized protein LOC122613227 n=1 Tax=Drosophila teissieri TaxID=7243 RepID=UPI001CBA0D8B|nr:uncharacterized protein LOC122613227 [Drosophila teissieri]